jgi:hypothetical protein
LVSCSISPVPCPSSETPERLRGLGRTESSREVTLDDLVDLGSVHRRAVRRDGDHDVVRSEPQELRGLDRGEHVADARHAERVERADRVRVDATRAQMLSPLRRVEQHVEPVGVAIAHVDDDVRVHHVVDQRHVLVADPLDVVLAESVAQ